MKPLVIYHGGSCRDGFCAAWVAHKALKDADFHEAKYGEAPPDVTGREVYILDFSYPLETLLVMADKALTVRMFDHHKTAEVDLAPLLTGAVPCPGNLFLTFDMKRSGAGMAWDYFYDRLPVDLRDPTGKALETGTGHRHWLVDYTEDRDLWKWQWGDNSRAVNAYISSQPLTFASYDRMAELTRVPTDLGYAVLDKTRQYVETVSKNSRRVPLGWAPGGLAIPDVVVVNAPFPDISELLNHLCKVEQAAGRVPIALGWHQGSDGMFNYSLRSIGEVDVSTIAKSFGGGGHKNSSGFRLGYLLG